MNARERWMDFSSEEIHPPVFCKPAGKIWDEGVAQFSGLDFKSLCNAGSSRTASAGSDLSYDDEMDAATEFFPFRPEENGYQIYDDYEHLNQFLGPFSFDFAAVCELMDFPVNSDVDEQKSPPELQEGRSEDSVLSTISSSEGFMEGMVSELFGDSNPGLGLPDTSSPPPPPPPSFLDPNAPGSSPEDVKGVRLVHLLMAAAEAVEARNRDLAAVILVRLKELASPSAATTMERLAAYLSHGLHGRLEGGRGPGLFPAPDPPPGDALASFQVLQEICPYIKFGHLTANQAILESVRRERRIHILDFDIVEGIQWPSLMQALAARKEAPPPHLRITALTRSPSAAARRGVSTVLETGRRLAAFAASVGLPFSFHQTRLDGDEKFRPAAARLVKGEAVVANCVLHLPHMTHRSPASTSSFLLGLREICPRIITLVQEAAQLPPTDSESYTSYFMETLHHYSAIFDSVEASFPPQSVARALVERIFLGPRIASRLALKHPQLNKNGSVNWSSFISSNLGFRSLSLSMFNQCQAKLLLGLFNDGYRIEEENGKLTLGWKSRPIISVSSWAAMEA